MSLNVLILAGQREGVIDPLCAESGIERKALLPICGKPMIDYVVDALCGTELISKFYVSGLNASHNNRLIQSPSAPGPAGSAMIAIEQGIETPLLITTADHPLLTAEMVRYFVRNAKDSGADFCVGFAEKDVIHPVYPHVKRTYLTFSDTQVSGCNLFYLANNKAISAIKFWQRAQNDRKQPWKLAWRFGLSTLTKYAFGRLSLHDGFVHASKLLGITARPILIPIPEAAIDVDKPSDKVLVESIVSQRISQAFKS